ncbi:MAG: hypothetical protein GXX10_01760 [Clostridiaceae bacterium]|nr:hypothetical protein [Clostridiaceae bacterium]
MSDNLKLYNAVRSVPSNALRTINAGRLKGKSDINPMWRIKALTEQFGPCGVGWKYTITKQWLEHGGNGEIAAFCNIDLYVKINGEWSEAIPGTGGSAFVANEKSGPYVSDECYKMALTDAISVACKALGFAADVYWDSDKTKYNSTTPINTQKKIDDAQAQVIYDLLKKTGADVKAFLEYYKISVVEDMTLDVWTKAAKALQSKLKKGEG